MIVIGIAHRKVFLIFFLDVHVFMPGCEDASSSEASEEHRNGAPSSYQALLVGSTSSLASLRLNGAELPPDRLITGRSLSEFRRAVTLRRGSKPCVS